LDSLGVSNSDLFSVGIAVINDANGDNQEVSESISTRMYSMERADTIFEDITSARNASQNEVTSRAQSGARMVVSLTFDKLGASQAPKSSNFEISFTQRKS